MDLRRADAQSPIRRWLRPAAAAAVAAVGVWTFPVLARASCGSGWDTCECSEMPCALVVAFLYWPACLGLAGLVASALVHGRQGMIAILVGILVSCLIYTVAYWQADTATGWVTGWVLATIGAAVPLFVGYGLGHGIARLVRATTPQAR